MSRGWIGVDLDGTLAVYDEWIDALHIGAPIPAMVERVKAWLVEGCDVRIFTARVGGQGEPPHPELETIRRTIEKWCLTHIGQSLPVTNAKDLHMVELWDDRAIQVVTNTGLRADGRP